MAKRTEKTQAEHPRAPEAAQRQRPRGKRSMQPPLTPMIDVTFQLLLFFLLTCEFRESEGLIPGSLPLGGNYSRTIEPPPDEPDPIRIRLHPTADRMAAIYQVNGARGTIHGPAELYAHLKGLHEQLGGADAPVVIVPKADVPWEFVVEAFNQAVRANFRKIGFPNNT